MATVVSEGTLTQVSRPSSGGLPRGVSLYGGDLLTYGELFRTQPQVRTVVSFLARNIAQLGIHVYRRAATNDRERLNDHPMAQLLRKPNPTTTRYQLINALVHDIAIYDNGFWAKVRSGSGRLGLVRLPPQRMEPLGDNWLAPSMWRLRGNRGVRDIPAEAIVHFHGYNPDDQRVGVSPLESLRQILAEEAAAAEYRSGLWRSGARVSGFIKRPPTAPKWSETARDRFKAGWQAAYSGDGTEIGGTPLLEDGMEFQEAGQTARDSQYIEARKLTREETAAAFHIPLPFVGILDHATFSNINEQHKDLYQDTLGPWLVDVEEVIELQLLPDVDPDPDVYLEFNIAEKLKGSFEEQAASIQTLVGAPVLSRNEGRALLNRNAVEGGDQLITPLNVLVGGQASPRDSAPKRAGVQLKARPVGRHVDKFVEVLSGFFHRQQTAIEARAGAKAASGPSLDDIWDGERWDRELTADLFALNASTAKAAVAALLDEIGETDFDTDTLLGWLEANASGVASGVNGTTREQLTDALRLDDWKAALLNVFVVAVSARAPQIAETQVTSVSGFASTEVASGTGHGSKTWVTTSSNPRPSHASMDGETVAIDDTFSNGARWPGDSTLDDDERAGCQCDLSYGR